MSDHVRIKLLREGARLPERATPGATGYDLYACLDADMELGPQPVKVPTGVAIEAPQGFDVQIRPRSGLSSQGVMVILGTIDADYRGELLVTMYVLPSTPAHTLHHGDRIAQLVISRTFDFLWQPAEDLSNTARDTGGHGSTGR